MQLPSDLRSEYRQKLVNAALRCDCLKTREGRDLLVQNLAEKISNNFQRSNHDRFDLEYIVNTCLAHTGGVEELLKLVEYYEQGNEPQQRLQLCVLELKVLCHFPLTEELLSELAAQLALADHEESAELYRRTLPSLPTRVAEAGPRTAYEAFLRLFGYQQINPLGFLEALAEIGVAGVRQWLQAAQPVLQAALAGRKKPDYSRRPATPFLLILVDPDVNAPERYSVRAWAWRSAAEVVNLALADTPCPAQALEGLVQECVRSARSKLGTTNFIIELIVLRQLFSPEINNWDFKVGRLAQPARLTEQQPLVLRWWDRVDDLQQPVQDLVPQWRDKWQALKAAPEALLSATLHWLSCHNQCSQQQLVNNFAAAANGLCLALGCALPKPYDQDNDLLYGALNAGTPIALWLCTDTVARDTFDGWFAQKTPLDLPQHVWELRREAEPHPGRHLMLLYDDADRLPPLPGKLAPPARHVS